MYQRQQQAQWAKVKGRNSVPCRIQIRAHASALPAAPVQGSLGTQGSLVSSPVAAQHHARSASKNSSKVAVSARESHPVSAEAQDSVPSQQQPLAVTELSADSITEPVSQEQPLKEAAAVEVTSRGPAHTVAQELDSPVSAVSQEHHLPNAIEASPITAAPPLASGLGLGKEGNAGSQQSQSIEADSAPALLPQKKTVLVWSCSLHT